MVDRKLNPYPTLYETYDLGEFTFRSDGVDKPELSLLSVNSIIGAEAAEVLYEKNIWRLSFSNEAYSAEDQLE